MWVHNVVLALVLELGFWPGSGLWLGTCLQQLLYSQGYAARAIQPGLYSQGYTARAIQPGLYIESVAVIHVVCLWLNRQGYVGTCQSAKTASQYPV